MQRSQRCPASRGGACCPSPAAPPTCSFACRSSQANPLTNRTALTSVLRQMSRHTQQACHASAEAPADAEFDQLARYEGALRGLPLAAGAGGIAGTLANRVLSGIAPVADAGSAQSRADVLLIGMCGVLVLTGLQWLALAPKQAEPVPPGGQALDWVADGLPPGAADELRWAWRALEASTRCCGLVALWDGAAVAQLGAAADGVEHGGTAAGELVRGAIASGRGNYLANLTLYPGRFEFFQFFPVATQGVALAPIGSRGCLVAAIDAVRGFSRLDQAWLAVLADKLDSTLAADGELAQETEQKPQAAAQR